MHICSKTHWRAQAPEILCPLVLHPANGDDDDDECDDDDDDDVENIYLQT